jgi:hypothetical protein
VSQKWPIWSQKIVLKENGEENDIRKIQRKQDDKPKKQ